MLIYIDFCGIYSTVRPMLFYDFVVNDYRVWIRKQVNSLLLQEFLQSTFFKSLILKIGECLHAKCFGSWMLMKRSVLSLSGSV